MGTDLVVHPLNPFPKSVGSTPMTIPTLTTQRLTLRPFRASDDQAYHQIVAEAGVLQYFPEPTPPSLEKVQATLSRLNEHWEKYGYGVWAVELAASGELIGRCGLFYIPQTDETEVDYLLAKQHWGKGFASEAASEALRFAFENAQKAAIVGIVHPENLASQHVLEKIGMRFTRADNYFGMDCLRYEIVRSKG